MKLTVLIENTSDSALLCEHGLSLFIEYNGRNYLLDAGQSGIFLKNAASLQVPVMDTDICILSHGHYDHAGGFADYLRENRHAVVYAMKGADEQYYSGSGGRLHAIGIPDDVLPVYKERFRFIDRMTKLSDGIYLVPHTTEGLKAVGLRAGLFCLRGEKMVPDDFSHEMSLVLDTKKGLVVCNSCSHAGIRVILKEVRELFPDKNVYAFIGGFHMKGKCDGKEICTFTETEIQELSEDLLAQGLGVLYTGHCTGEPGFELLRKYLGGRIQRLRTGKAIVIES